MSLDCLNYSICLELSLPGMANKTTVNYSPILIDAFKLLNS